LIGTKMRWPCFRREKLTGSAVKNGFSRKNAQ
jgi:hypothetical protein